MTLPDGTVQGFAKDDPALKEKGARIGTASVKAKAGKPAPSLKMILDVSTEWRKSLKPFNELLRQRDLMEVGLEAAKRGDMAQGSQAVLVTFQKILTRLPLSVSLNTLEVRRGWPFWIV